MSEINLDSYPPEFLHQNPISPFPFPTEPDRNQTLAEIDVVPSIDLHNLDLQNLREACKEWGLFRIVNHGIPLTLLTQLHDQTKQVFCLPFDLKKEVITSPLSYFWGTPALSPAGVAVSAGRNINWVEGLNIPLSELSLVQPLHPTLDSFRVVLEEYGKHITRIATTLYQAMIETLKFQYPDKSYLSESSGIFRVYRYPQSSTPDETWGMKAHTDSSVLSIIAQQEVSGLQILEDDQWIDVPPIPNTLILNLGDMMQAISDDEFKSVTHRVKASTCQERYSICYFVFPEDETVIHSSNYKPFTYREFRDQVQQDIKTLGFKVGLDRFKLTDLTAGKGERKEDVQDSCS